MLFVYLVTSYLLLRVMESGGGAAGAGSAAEQAEAHGSDGAAASAKRPIRIVGVPEHFNRPVQMMADFVGDGEMEFQIQGGGTGAMLKAVKEGQSDVAIALTEGVVAEVVRGGGELAIAGLYVDAPLTWSIVVAVDSPYKTLADLEGQTVGVSRMGSGSHLMAFLLAEREGWDTSALSFEVLTDFVGLRRGVSDGKAAFFMWETFTTGPFTTEKGGTELRKIGEIPTPWPCFCLAMRRDTLDEPGAVERYKSFFTKLRGACGRFKADGRLSVRDVAAIYGLELADAKAWFRGVEYSDRASIQREVIEQTQRALLRLGIISKVMAAEDVVDARVTSVVDEPSMPRAKPRLSSDEETAAAFDRETGEDTDGPIPLGSEPMLTRRAANRSPGKAGREELRAQKAAALHAVLDHLDKWKRN